MRVPGAPLLDRLGRGLRSPLVQAVVFYVLFVAVALPARAFGVKEGPILFGAAMMTIFSVANPISLIFVPRFWLNLLLSVVVWFALFFAITVTIETAGHMGDDGMVFLGACMLFPVALFSAGIIRLVRRRKAGAAVAG